MVLHDDELTAAWAAYAAAPTEANWRAYQAAGKVAWARAGRPSVLYASLVSSTAGRASA